MIAVPNISLFPVKPPHHPDTAAEILQSFPFFKMDRHDPDWLAALRQRGVEYLQVHGLPTPKLEGWKFTNLMPKVKGFGTAQGQTKVRYNDVPGVEILPLQDSALNSEWVRGLIAGEVPPQDANADPALWHLANVFFRDGISIDVPAGLQAATPLTITMECEDGHFHMVHTAVRVGAGANLTIIEDHCGAGRFWKNRLTHIVLEPGARLTHVRIQEDAAESVYTQTTNVNVAQDAAYEAVALYTGAALSRNQVRVALNASGAGCHLNSVSLMRGTQQSDTTILVEHYAPHCQSNQNIRTILDDQARGVFQGKIHVHQPSQKTNGYQMSRALILSEGAEMDTKPELEIYADDVKCSHGATTGRLDEEPLFYMQSRGIGREAARALLIEAFAAEGLSLVAEREWYPDLIGRVQEWLQH